MIGVAVLVALAGAFQTSSTAASSKIEIAASVSNPDGSASAGRSTIDVGVTPTIWFLSSGKSVCEVRSATAARPTDAGYGWRLELSRVALRDPQFLAVKAKWERLWEGGRPTVGGETRTQTVLLKAGEKIILDSIPNLVDRPSISRPRMAALSSLSAEQLIASPEMRIDPIILQYSMNIASVDRSIRLAIDVDKLGPANSTVIGLRTERAGLLSLAVDRAKALLGEADRSPSALATPADGCSALNLTLELARVLPGTSAGFEAEIWLVHVDPSSKETTQKQVVRAISSSAEYVFDPETLGSGVKALKTWTAGRISSVTYRDGRFTGELRIERKWDNGQSGWATYKLSLAAGEVVAFPLGAPQSVAGDRLSLRVRLTPLNRR